MEISVRIGNMENNVYVLGGRHFIGKSISQYCILGRLDEVDIGSIPGFSKHM